MLGGRKRRFHSRPLEIEAILFDGANADEIIGWLGEALCQPVVSGSASSALRITTPEGDRHADAGDWVVKGPDGIAYPLKSMIFTSKFMPQGGG